MASEGWLDSSCYGHSRLCNSAALFGRRVRNATDSDNKKNRHCVLFDCPESSVSYAIVLVPWLVGGRRLKMRELSHEPSSYRVGLPLLSAQKRPHPLLNPYFLLCWPILFIISPAWDVNGLCGRHCIESNLLMSALRISTNVISSGFWNIRQASKNTLETRHGQDHVEV